MHYKVSIVLADETITKSATPRGRGRRWQGENGFPSLPAAGPVLNCLTNSRNPGTGGGQCGSYTGAARRGSTAPGAALSGGRWGPGRDRGRGRAWGALGWFPEAGPLLQLEGEGVKESLEFQCCYIYLYISVFLFFQFSNVLKRRGVKKLAEERWRGCRHSNSTGKGLVSAFWPNASFQRPSPDPHHWPALRDRVTSLVRQPPHSQIPHFAPPVSPPPHLGNRHWRGDTGPTHTTQLSTLDKAIIAQKGQCKSMWNWKMFKADAGHTRQDSLSPPGKAMGAQQGGT